MAALVSGATGGWCCHEGVSHTDMPTAQGEEGKGWEIDAPSRDEGRENNPSQRCLRQG